jgi:hypothetical protein
MGRGLGKLQSDILCLLLDKGILRVRVILSQLFGWRGKAWKDGQIFSQAFIGEEEYRLRHASLSRSLERLRQRGLVEIFKSGYGTAIGLTNAGRAEAQRIMALEEH